MFEIQTTSLGIIMNKTISIQTATEEAVAILKLSPRDTCHFPPGAIVFKWGSCRVFRLHGVNEGHNDRLPF